MTRKSPGETPTKVPDRIVEQLIRQISDGTLKPGERLPPLRELSVQMGVDRTSLRIALERLHQMNLVSLIQGSGVVVLDYREHAGTSFLQAVYSLPGSTTPVHDSHLLLQMMEFMGLLVPGLIGLASHRATPMQIERLIAVLRQHLDHLDDLDALAELRTDTEDLIADIVGNLVIKLVYNSTRPLRKRLNRRILETLDVPRHVETQIQWLRQFLTGGVRRVDVETMYSSFQSESLARTREELLANA